MTSTEKELIEKIYSDPQKFEAARDFFEIWNQHLDCDALEENLIQKFKEKFPGKHLPTKTKINGFIKYFWECEKKGCLIFWNGRREVGFISHGGEIFSKEKQAELLETINKIKTRDREYDYSDDYYVGCSINDSANLFKDIMDALEVLFKIQ